MKTHQISQAFLALLFAAAVSAAAQECDRLHRLDPGPKITEKGASTFRARRSLRLAAQRECETRCNTINQCEGEQCRTLLPPVGAPLMTWPKCRKVAKDTYECKATLRYCPCACRTGAPEGRPPAVCKGTHDVSFSYRIQGKSVVSNQPGDADRAVGRAREQMKEMARSACDAFCMAIACEGDDPCIRNGSAPGDAIDPPQGDCKADGNARICEAELTKCKCKCARG